MKSHQNNRPSEVRQRILVEAVRLFAQNGFEGTSIRAVADAVGIKNPSLLYYFGSKEQLLEAVVDDLLEHWKSELPQLISKSTNSRERFASLVESVVAFFLEDQNRARLFIREMLDRPAELGARIREQLGPWIGLISDYINLGKERGTIKSTVDAEYYIFQVILIVAGTVTLSSAAQAVSPEGSQSSMTMTEGVVRATWDLLFVKPYSSIH